MSFEGERGWQRQKSQGGGFDGHLFRIPSECPSALAQLALDECLNTSEPDLLRAPHGSGSRRQLRDCQIPAETGERKHGKRQP